MYANIILRLEMPSLREIHLDQSQIEHSLKVFQQLSAIYYSTELMGQVSRSGVCHNGFYLEEREESIFQKSVILVSLWIPFHIF